MGLHLSTSRGLRCAQASRGECLPRAEGRAGPRSPTVGDDAAQRVRRPASPVLQGSRAEEGWLPGSVAEAVGAWAGSGSGAILSERGWHLEPHASVDGPGAPRTRSPSASAAPTHRASHRPQGPRPRRRRSRRVEGAEVFWRTRDEEGPSRATLGLGAAAGPPYLLRRGGGEVLAVWSPY